MSSSHPASLRGLAVLAGTAAVAVYTWGLLHIAGAVLEAEDGGTGSAPLPPCRSSEQAVHVVDYSVSYVPLSFVCELKDGGGYTAEVVPAYVNPVALGLALTAAGCGLTSAYVQELRLRARS